jgi:clan AA aspartic protease
VGTFSVEIEVGNQSREEFVAVEALVDTGAIYTMLPEDLLERLGVKRLESDIFQMADDSLVEYWIGTTTVRIQGRALPVPVVFARPDNTPLVGATTIEILRLIVDPIEERLIPAPPIRARFF